MLEMRRGLQMLEERHSQTEAVSVTGLWPKEVEASFDSVCAYVFGSCSFNVLFMFAVGSQVFAIWRGATSLFSS